jgi:hypothetical protein
MAEHDVPGIGSIRREPHLTSATRVIGDGVLLNEPSLAMPVK